MDTSLQLLLPLILGDKRSHYAHLCTESNVSLEDLRATMMVWTAYQLPYEYVFDSNGDVRDQEEFCKSFNKAQSRHNVRRIVRGISKSLAVFSLDKLQATGQRNEKSKRGKVGLLAKGVLFAWNLKAFYDQFKWRGLTQDKIAKRIADLMKNEAGMVNAQQYPIWSEQAKLRKLRNKLKSQSNFSLLWLVRPNGTIRLGQTEINQAVEFYTQEKMVSIKGVSRVQSWVDSQQRKLQKRLQLNYVKPRIEISPTYSNSRTPEQTLTNLTAPTLKHPSP